MGGEALGLAGSLAYTTDLFNRETAHQLVVRFERLLASAVASPELPLHRLEVLSAEERRQVLEGFNETHRELPQTTLVELFECQVEKSPETPAVVMGEASLSYGELNVRANQLAHHLIGLGVGPETLVGVCLERSLELVVSLLGVLKARGAYVPLDPSYPQARLAYMIQDTSPSVVITTSAWRHVIDQRLNVVEFDAIGLQTALVQAPKSNPTDENRRDPLLIDHSAYVIYTSGSTGQPKGVVIRHRELTNYLMWAKDLFEAEQGEGAPINTPIAFDATVTSFHLCLSVGRPIILIPEVDEIEALAELLASGTDFTLVKLTPAYLEGVSRVLGSRIEQIRVRCFVLGGDTLSSAIAAFWRRHLPQTTFFNHYGPTEAVVGSCAYRIGDLEAISGSVPIGSPAANKRLYVLNDALEPFPVGVVGELYIGGTQLGLGYLDREGLTSERFVADPYGPPGSRMYRTGDLAKWRADGTLEFMERVDNQVKLRGYRIELGDIESVLMSHELVSQAAVILREEGAGEPALVAYVVPRSEEGLKRAELTQYVSAQLPAYMVPRAVVELETLPLTPNGKLDRRALPAPEHQVMAYRGPRTPEEAVLSEVFAEVLGLERVGVDEDFFALGGHSLLATRLVSRVREVLGVEVSIRTLFEAPTVAELWLAMYREITPSSGLATLLPLRSRGNLPPLFCVHPAGRLSWCHAGLICHLHPQRPLWGLQAARVGDADAPQPHSLEAMAKAYLSAIREHQPHGPYHLLGWSFGDSVAQTLACQLQQEGESVALLAILDNYPQTASHEQPLPTRRELLANLFEQSPDLDALTVFEAARRAGVVLPGFDALHHDRMLEVMQHDMRLSQDHRFNRFKGDMILFVATQGEVPPPPPETWAPYISGQIEVYNIACRHVEMTLPEPLKAIGQRLEQYLQ